MWQGISLVGLMLALAGITWLSQSPDSPLAKSVPPQMQIVDHANLRARGMTVTEYETSVEVGVRPLLWPPVVERGTIKRVSFVNYDGRRYEALIACATPDMTLTHARIYVRINRKEKATYYVQCKPPTSPGPPPG
jgi:hypothetical protein